MSRKILDLSGLNYYDDKIKSYVETKAAEAAAGKITMEVLVGNLPDVSAASLNVIYLKPNSEGESGNSYDEYIVKVVSSVRSWEKIGTTQADLNAKANKSEMSVVDNGNGTATITLKNNTSATVLTQHQDISGKANKANDPHAGHLASLDANGHLVDSGIDKDDALYESDVDNISTGEIDTLFPDDDDKGIPDQGEATRIDFTINDGTTTKTYHANSGANWTGWCATEDNELGLVPVWTQQGSGKLAVMVHRVRGTVNSVLKELDKSEGGGLSSKVDADTAIEANATYVLSTVS